MNDLEFEKLFREQFTPLCRLAYSVLKDGDLAKDIVQQVFLNLWQKKDSLKIHTAIKPYLCRAVVNTAINSVKRNSKTIALDSSIHEPMSMSDEEKNNLHHTPINLEEKVHHAINELPPVCSKVFALSRFSDLTNKEIAAELNISVKAVEKHITKAIKSLRVSLKPLLTIETTILLILIFTYTLSVFKVGFWLLNLSF